MIFVQYSLLSQRKILHCTFKLQLAKTRGGEMTNSLRFTNRETLEI